MTGDQFWHWYLDVRNRISEYINVTVQPYRLRPDNSTAWFFRIHKHGETSGRIIQYDRAQCAMDHVHEYAMWR